MPDATPTPDFCPEFARTIVVALTTYGPTLRLAVEYSEHPDDDQRVALLHTISRRVGLELLAYVRTTEDLGGAFSPEENPAPVMKLARLLGESIALLGAITDGPSALRVPVASLLLVDAAYDAAARAWLSRYVDELPERTDEEGAPA